MDAIEPTQVAFGLIPKIIDTVDMVLSVGEQLGMVNAAVVKIGNIQSILGIECISVNNTIWLYFLLEDRRQCHNS